MLYMDGKFGWNIYSRKSKDDGLTWSDAIIVRKSYKDTSKNDNVCYACPDFIELPNGQILVAYQWRYNNGYNDIENTNRNCGIETIVSLNMGDSFVAASVKKAYWGRNWEPSFVLLPSGELQMFFTDTHTLQCNVGLIRSFDYGNTWKPTTSVDVTGCEYISRTEENGKTYDGMAVGQYLNNDNGIAIALECDGGSKTPWIVKSSVENNWIYPDFTSPMTGPEPDRKKLLHEDFRGFAPYMEKLPSGEVIVQSNGKFTKDSSEKMWVFIGDEKAENFSYASSPHASWWGSVAYIGNEEIISSGNAGYKENGTDYQMLRITKGKINRSMSIKKGEIETFPLGSFDRTLNKDWFIGGISQAQAYMHMKYTEENLNIGCHIYDKQLNYYTTMNSDAIQMLVYRKNTASSVEDIYRITINIKEEIKIEKQNEGGIFENIDPSGSVCVAIIEGTIGDNSDEDMGYSTKTSIPWTIIGGFPDENEEFRVHLIQRNNDRTSSILPSVTESMPGEVSSDSKTWLKVSFDDLSNTSIKPEKIHYNQVYLYQISKGTLKISGFDNTNNQLSHIKVSGLDGKNKECKLSQDNTIDISHLPAGIYLIQLYSDKGEVFVCKIVLH